jgi:hypothetical protein
MKGIVQIAPLVINYRAFTGGLHLLNRSAKP